MKKRFIAVTCVVMLCAMLVLTACSGGTSIVGKWNMEQSGITATIEFKSDGTFTIALGSADLLSGTYKIEGSKLTMDMDGISQSQYYRVEGNQLILSTTEGGEAAQTLTRA